MLRIGILVILLIVSMLVVTAQGQDEAICPTGQMGDAADILEDFAARLRDETDDVLPIIYELRDRVARFAAACSGLKFSSDVEGLQPVIGPVRIPTGLHRVTATTTGFMIVKIETLDGKCVSRGLGGIFNLTAGQADQGAQQLFESEDCEVLLLISNTREAWTLEFERLR